MDTIQKTKKQEIIDTLNKIEDVTKDLGQLLENIYESPSLENEKKFVKSCNYIQMLAKQALNHTGYYKALSGVPRSLYAPEELGGDITDISNLVNSEMSRIEKSLEEGKSLSPINEPDITKQQWLESIESHKQHFKKTYEDWATFNENQKQKGSDFIINSPETSIIMDDEIIEAAKGFMVGPIGLFRNKCVAAETQVFENIHEMKIFLINVQCKTKDMVLYMTFKQGEKCFWRGAFVDKK